MKDLEQLLGVGPGIQGAARADAAGNVLTAVGEMDAESIGAVAAMCRPALEKASSIAGLGALRDWSFSYAQGSLYVHDEGEGFVAVLGGPSKNPETIMKKITQVLTESGS